MEKDTSGTLRFIVNSGFKTKIVYYENGERKEVTCKLIEVISLSFVCDLPFTDLVYVPLRYITEIKVYQHTNSAEIFIGDTNGNVG